MEDDAEIEEKRNDALSQSYTQRVERVVQQSNDVGIKFELPKEVLEKRERGWDNFFEKYADEASDDIELNIETMEPVATEEEDDEEEEEDEEPGEYYSKCRAPMRKLPALIQYWIDTGNPPYQLVGEDDNSETGSSLSEGEPSRTGHSEVLRESSSVDTTAYILSNKNTTKKSETAAIVEGARKPEDPKLAKTSPHKNKLPLQNEPILDLNKQTSTDHDVKTVSSLTKNLSASPSPKNDTTELNNLLNSSISSHNQSVKLSQVLPTFSQIDELLNESLRKFGTDKRACLSRVRANDPTISQSSLSNGTRKSVNRRKLYTGRNSPIDLILERTSVDSVEQTCNFLHPALEPDCNGKSSRPRSRRKRKRASETDKNSSQDSSTAVFNEKPKGEMRYEDFFESLGLTPSKTIIGGKSLPKRLKKIGNPLRENDEGNSIKETHDTSIFSMDTRKRELLGNKILSLKIDRLSESCLARYRNKEKSKIDTASSSSSGSKKVKSPIELLTTTTQDSDSSTILIIACNNDNNGHYSDSDNSLFTRNPLKLSMMKKRASPRKKPIKTDSVTRNFEELTVTKKATNLLDVSVRLEKMEIGSATREETSSIRKKSRSSENKSVTIGRNFVNNEIPRKLRKVTPVSFKTSITWDEEEDSFVKLVENLGTEMESIKNGSEVSNENATKLRNFEISVSSDEEDDVSTKKGKKNLEESNSRKITKTVKTQEGYIRRSTRTHRPPSWGDTDNLTSMSSFEKPKTSRNIFGKSSFTDKEVSSENRKTAKSKYDESRRKKMKRFETRLDSDTDSEFELLRFSINPNYKESDIPNSPEFNKKKELRSSPRRSLKHSNLGAKETKSFEDSPNNSNPAKNDALQVTPSKINRSSTESTPKMFRKSPKSKQENPNVQKKRSKRVPPLKKATKTVKNQPNSKSPKRKLRRTRILGKPMEYETDDDEQTVQKEASNVTSSNNSSDKKLSNDQNSWKKRPETSRNLFASSHIDSVDDINLFFSNDAASRARDCKVVINSLKFVSGKKHKNRQSKISFRTKLRSDSDNDDVL